MLQSNTLQIYSIYESDKGLQKTNYGNGLAGKDKLGYAASKGFKRAIAIINSQLCTRVDLYGWTPGGSGKVQYHNHWNVLH